MADAVLIKREFEDRSTAKVYKNHELLQQLKVLEVELQLTDSKLLAVEIVKLSSSPEI